MKSLEISAFRIAGRPVPQEFYSRYGIPRSSPRLSTVSIIDQAWANVKTVFSGGNGLSRYSSGFWPILYTACEQLTAMCEKGYWITTSVFCKQTKPVEVPCIEYRLTLAGTTEDYFGQELSSPLLVHPTDYSFCQEIGEQAISRKIDFLLVPSARRVGGKTLLYFPVRQLPTYPEL